MARKFQQGKEITMDETEKRIKKDLILRERLAIERTDMAIDRTLLSFIRTSLYFAIAGMTVNSLLKVSYGIITEIFFWCLSIMVLVIGLLKFRQQKKKLKLNEKHIGDYKLDWEDDIE
jgi:putative membrane protein